MKTLHENPLKQFFADPEPLASSVRAQQEHRRSVEAASKRREVSSARRAAFAAVLGFATIGAIGHAVESWLDKPAAAESSTGEDASSTGKAKAEELESPQD